MGLELDHCMVYVSPRSFLKKMERVSLSENISANTTIPATIQRLVAQLPHGML